ncbi:hypothetical protein PLICRDRAFT_142762 [Plicaturopsis crispa FD-325 SS-3]|nr:hypothetical protein PLICRDRAFT_142762 [Plicaturopsis crispa FD-325 SS-3]
MSHAQKRLVSTAAKKIAVSPAHLKAFPPRESLLGRKVPTVFEPDTWASLQPPAPSALAAFPPRIGLASVLDTPQLTQRICTHSSFVPLHLKYYPKDPAPASNAQLASLGNALMGLFATEHLHAAYPHLPTRVLKAAVSAHVGPLTCATVAQEMGATPLLRWHRTPTTLTTPAVLHSDALSSIPRAITALIYQKRSLLSARKFVHTFFLSREIDLRSMIKFYDPKKALAETVAKFKRERPKSRLLKETGRFSNSPVFVVGIYSGPDQLGEGFGSSLKMAEFRAAEDALHRVFLTRTPPQLIQLPSSTFPAEDGNIFQGGPEGEYTPGELGSAEGMYASSGRSSIVLPQRRVHEEGEGDRPRRSRQ